MNVEKFIEIVNSNFYTGVPDSQLRELCDCLISRYGIDPKHHIIAANEGNCVALAAGYYIATGDYPVVYMQNSGEGNAINPIASLINEKVYAIPVIFVIGWRGEPGEKDEPQHIYQGEITLKLLDLMGIESCVIDGETSEEEIKATMNYFNKRLSLGKSVAFVIRKNAFSYEKKVSYQNCFEMNREQVIEHVLEVSKDDPIISTTGKASRELFEVREKKCQTHERDFLTVGSMGHCSSIALGIAINKVDKKIWCIDGDGAALMHMGAIAVIGKISPQNLVHIIINNCSHETVGGMPAVSECVNFVEVAKACGYPNAVSVKSYEELNVALNDAKSSSNLFLIEVKTSIESRKNLGRPTTTTYENIKQFTDALLDAEKR